MLKRFCCLLMSLSMISILAFAQKQGSSTGFYATYGMSQFYNYDDVNFKPVLKLNTTLKYGAGIEKANWWGNHFGYGFKIGYHAIGQDYTALDTIGKTRVEIKSNIHTFQTSALVFYRSYNRYHPARRLRFNAHFGPMISLNPLFSEQATVYDANNKILAQGEFTPLGYRGATTSIADFDLTRPIYRFTSFGFTFCPGVEMTLGKKTSLYLNALSTIYSTNIENRGLIERKNVVGPNTPFPYWDNLLAKNFPTAANPTEFNRRPETRPMYLGGVLGIRFYTHDQIDEK